MAEDKEEKKGDGAGEKAQQMLAQAGQFGKDHWKAIGVVIAGITLVVVYLQYRNSLGATTSTTTTSTPPSDQTPVDTTLGNNPTTPTTGGGGGGGPVSGPVYGGGGGGGGGPMITDPASAAAAQAGANLATQGEARQSVLNRVAAVGAGLAATTKAAQTGGAFFGSSKAAQPRTAIMPSLSAPAAWGSKASASAKPVALSGFISAGRTHFNVE